MEKGDKIYVPDKQKARYGDAVTGGLATIEVVKELSDGIYVTTAETGKIQWNLKNLLANQELYKKQYGGFDARSYPEEFERDNFIW